MLMPKIVFDIVFKDVNLKINLHVFCKLIFKTLDPNNIKKKKKKNRKICVNLEYWGIITIVRVIDKLKFS